MTAMAEVKLKIIYFDFYFGVLGLKVCQVPAVFGCREGYYMFCKTLELVPPLLGFTKSAQLIVFIMGQKSHVNCDSK